MSGLKKYRIIIAGSGDFTNYDLVKSVMRNVTKDMEFNEIEIICGCCPRGKLTYETKEGESIYGADGLGAKYAIEKGYSLMFMSAEWVKYGRSAGPRRNTQMAKYATHCYVFWDGLSKGSGNMIEKSVAFNLIGEAILEPRL